MTTVRVVVCAAMFAASAACVRGQGAPDLARPPALDRPRVGLYDSVTVALRKRWADTLLLQYSVEPAIEAYRAAADSARTFGDEVRVVRRMLQQIPVTSVFLTSATAWRSLERAIRGDAEPMFGMQVMYWRGHWYAAAVLDGGPAARAGVRPWDEVHMIDGRRPAESEILDYSLDDAYLDDERDPPMHPLRAVNGQTITLRVSQTPRDTVDIAVTASTYGAFEATERSVRVMEIEGGVRIGIVHLWYMFFAPNSDWLSRRFDDEWQDVDALMLDLRGRGGYPDFALGAAGVVSTSPRQRYRGPVVVLQDRQTRSAKEVFIDALRTRAGARLVGEATAGSSRGSITVPVGHGLVLSIPSPSPLPPAQSRFELHPIDPDVAVPWAGPRAAKDPIFEAGIEEVLRLIDANGRGAVFRPLPPTGATLENSAKVKVRQPPTMRRP